MPQKTYDVAVIGATGNVGRALLNIMAERHFPARQISALASSHSAGQQVSFGEKDTLVVQDVNDFDFQKTDIVLSAVPNLVAKELLPKILKKGVLIIDKSSAFRMQKETLLMIPEVNGILLKNIPSPIPNEGILIANPNCVVIPLVMALYPLHQKSGLKKLTVATYQSVSGAGTGGMQELFNQTRKIFVNDPIEKTIFPKQMAFNIIPQIGPLLPGGSSQEEHHIRTETQKIFNIKLPVHVMCVRVPVFTGHALAVFAEFEEELPLREAQKALQNFPGICLTASKDFSATSPMECAGEDEVYISRLRQEPGSTHCLSFWACCDNLRKGAALNSVQIAENFLNYFPSTLPKQVS